MIIDFTNKGQGGTSGGAQKLVSGTEQSVLDANNALHVKTINGQSIAGLGNVTINGGGDYKVVNQLSTPSKEGEMVYLSEDYSGYTKGQYISSDKETGETTYEYYGILTSSDFAGTNVGDSIQYFSYNGKVISVKTTSEGQVYEYDGEEYPLDSTSDQLISTDFVAQILDGNIKFYVLNSDVENLAVIEGGAYFWGWQVNPDYDKGEISVTGYAIVWEKYSIPPTIIEITQDEEDGTWSTTTTADQIKASAKVKNAILKHGNDYSSAIAYEIYDEDGADESRIRFGTANDGYFVMVSANEDVVNVDYQVYTFVTSYDNSIVDIMKLTQAEYDDLEEKSDYTLYIIVD